MRQNNRCFQKITRKLNNEKGFSLSEMLMAVLVVVLIASFVGGGTVVVKNSYERITLKAEAQTLLSTTMTAVMDDFRFAKEIAEGDTEVTDALGTITFDSLSRGYRMAFVADTSADHSQGICVRAVGTENILPVVTWETMTDRLYTEMTALSYDASSESFSVTIAVKKKSDNAVIESRTQIVKPVNGN